MRHGIRACTAHVWWLGRRVALDVPRRAVSGRGLGVAPHGLLPKPAVSPPPFGSLAVSDAPQGRHEETFLPYWSGPARSGNKSTEVVGCPVPFGCFPPKERSGGNSSKPAYVVHGPTRAQ
eukprot:CAMPEP_0197390992 /NCGR_PEP_ID=MMETSP1165-20131217/2787_1 /TAXON_ID=284809 /ORGANISM="Chrysocystis fragilis, Strain CCMP3189" /LENGTH=119 /DNA_ID=CAMNT_0042916525 /DNA_START=232 /DNA_END=589 /DNA_ORIENTATION=-